ncbi:MAG: sulfite exporter TauE/SafE family protein [Dehalococcoidia bacterium]|nr:sulfite exporter TauE/SafE family protein [Dehalococcoidia bacterium]
MDETASTLKLALPQVERPACPDTMPFCFLAALILLYYYMGSPELLNGAVLIVFLVGLGFFAGAYGTLVGIGGAVVLTPILLLIYPGADPRVLTSITMAVVFINALSGTAAYMRLRRIDYRSGFLFAIATVPGTVLGVWVLGHIPQKTFESIFGAALLMFSVLIWTKPRRTVSFASGRGAPVAITDRHGEIFSYSVNRPLGVALSFATGFIAGLLGIGGGIIHMPALIYLLGFPAHVATATSHFILVFTGLTGTLTHAVSGAYAQVWTILLPIAAGVIPGAQLGAWLSRRVKGPLLMRLLALALAMAGARMLVLGIIG